MAGVGSRSKPVLKKSYFMAAILAVATLVATGFYPVHKTLQKEARVRVVSACGETISGAEVHLITSSYPYSAERDRETKTTDADGVATFVKKSEWRRPRNCGDPKMWYWEPAEPAFGGYPPGTQVSCTFFPAATPERPEPEYETRSECASFDAAAYPQIDEDVLAQADYHHGLTEMLIDSAWYYVRSTGESLRVVSWDNGPDPWSEGLVRVDRIERIAYADRDFREVIGPRFDRAWPFRDGLAIVCFGCSSGEADADGHREVTGGHWGAVDKSGNAVVPFTHKSYGEIRQAIDAQSQDR